MIRPYHHIEVERNGEVWCVRFRQPQLSEDDLYDACDELIALLKDGCRKVVLNLGPPDPEFLYSIFLAKLVSLQRRLHAVNGGLKLANASPALKSIFEACRLTSLFDFVPDQETALQEFARTASRDLLSEPEA